MVTRIQFVGARSCRRSIDMVVLSAGVRSHRVRCRSGERNRRATVRAKGDVGLRASRGGSPRMRAEHAVHPQAKE